MTTTKSGPGVVSRSIPQRPTIYVNAKLMDILVARKHAEVSTSALLERIGDRYGQIIRRYTPAFSKYEWYALLNALRGLDNYPVANAVDALPGHLLTALQHNDSVKQWSLDETLVDRVSAMSWVERLAIIDIAEQFWTASLDSIDTEANLRGTGARVLEDGEETDPPSNTMLWR